MINLRDEDIKLIEEGIKLMEQIILRKDIILKLKIMLKVESNLSTKEVIISIMLNAEELFDLLQNFICLFLHILF